MRLDPTPGGRLPDALKVRFGDACPTVHQEEVDMRMTEPPVDARPSMGGLGQPSDEILRGNGGLALTDERARARGATVSVTDGPFTETKEMIGSFAFSTALSF